MKGNAKSTSSDWRLRAKEHTVIQQGSQPGEIGAYRVRNRGRAGGITGILSVALGSNVDDVCEGIPYEDFRRPLAEHPMGVELRARRCTVGQDEHQGEGKKEREDKFPRLDVEHSGESGYFLEGRRPRV